jgi:predicted O-methyltransferase YrrM
MTPDFAVSHLETVLDALPETGTLLEIGSGWSTVWFAERLQPQQQLISVEHDVDWYAKILPYVAKHQNVEYLLREVRTWGGWGEPTRENPSHVSQYIHAADYAEADVVLIDGLARGACFAAALFNVEAGAVIFHHDAERTDWYEWAWELVPVTCEQFLHPPAEGHKAELYECRIA